MAESGREMEGPSDASERTALLESATPGRPWIGHALLACLAALLTGLWWALHETGGGPPRSDPVLLGLVPSAASALAALALLAHSRTGLAAYVLGVAAADVAAWLGALGAGDGDGARRERDLACRLEGAARQLGTLQWAFLAAGVWARGHVRYRRRGDAAQQERHQRWAVWAPAAVGLGFVLVPWAGDSYGPAGGRLCWLDADRAAAAGLVLAYLPATALYLTCLGRCRDVRSLRVGQALACLFVPSACRRLLELVFPDRLWDGLAYLDVLAQGLRGLAVAVVLFRDDGARLAAGGRWRHRAAVKHGVALGLCLAAAVLASLHVPCVTFEFELFVPVAAAVAILAAGWAARRAVPQPQPAQGPGHAPLCSDAACPQCAAVLRHLGKHFAADSGSLYSHRPVTLVAQPRVEEYPCQGNSVLHAQREQRRQAGERAPEADTFTTTEASLFLLLLHRSLVSPVWLRLWQLVSALVAIQPALAPLYPWQGGCAWELGIHLLNGGLAVWLYLLLKVLGRAARLYLERCRLFQLFLATLDPDAAARWGVPHFPQAIAGVVPTFDIVAGPERTALRLDPAQEEALRQSFEAQILAIGQLRRSVLAWRDSSTERLRLLLSLATFGSLLFSIVSLGLAPAAGHTWDTLPSTLLLYTGVGVQFPLVAAVYFGSTCNTLQQVNFLAALNAMTLAFDTLYVNWNEDFKKRKPMLKYLLGVATLWKNDEPRTRLVHFIPVSSNLLYGIIWGLYWGALTRWLYKSI